MKPLNRFMESFKQRDCNTQVSKQQSFRRLYKMKLITRSR